MLKAIINPYWATGLSVEELVRPEAPASRLLRQIDLPKLGGLAFVLGDGNRHLFDADEATRLAEQCGAIDLSQGEPAVMTTTNTLYSSAVDQHRFDSDDLADQLRAISAPTPHTSGNNAWLFPLISGVTLVSSGRVQATQPS